MKYVHTNIICLDVNKIASFYIGVFGCKQIGSETKISGDWVEKGTGIDKAEARAINLQLPGYEKGGPTLEIFQYSTTLESERSPLANSKGIGHLAFSVDNVQETFDKVIQNGGRKLGDVIAKEFKSGTLTYVYVTDPEGNIIEVQSWTPKS